MVSGKDSSNPLMANNLTKIVWYSTHHVALIKSWLVQKQTALGVNTPRCDEDRLELIELMVFLLPKLEKVGIGVNDVTRLEALIDKKVVVVTEATIREALHSDDAKGVECLPNEEIFTELARMGYEKPSTKLTFYKAFFSSQWKFLIHTILQCMSAKRTSWNEFSSSMASAVICLSSGRKFNFSKKQVGDLSTHTTKYTSPALIQKVFANIRQIDKGFSGVETSLFEGMIVEQPVVEGDADEVHGEDVNAGDVAEGDVSAANDKVPTADEQPSIPSLIPPTPPPQPSQDIPSTFHVQPTPPQSPQVQQQSPQPQPQTSQDARISMNLLQDLMDTYTTLTRRVEHLELDKIAQALEITKLKQRVKKLERRNKVKVLTLRRLRQVGTGQRTDTSDDNVMDNVSNQGRMIDEMDQDADVVLKESKDVDDIVKDDQDAKVDEEDESEPTELQEVVDIVTTTKLITEAKEDPAVKRYQAFKRKPQTEAQARKNMMIYLKNVAGFKMDYFKGMSYDDIRPIFEVKFNTNVAFLQKTKEQINEEESRALKRINETLAEKAAKRKKLDEEVEDLKRHLQIVLNEEDDVYTEATPLARKKNQRSVYGPAKVKSWKLLESCGVQIIAFTTTQLILLVDRKYPLTKFTLDQMLNVVRLEFEEESEVSFELLRFIQQQHQKGAQLE
uniref:Synaptobrevin, longin-like domain protein n=1 Tax=Tanacetum cinerariifolium TaxID=118510 RepID=A0A699GY36_TANCI|nr:hypothetical protein [Tanacetum cinerariifolium]